VRGGLFGVQRFAAAGDPGRLAGWPAGSHTRCSSCFVTHCPHDIVPITDDSTLPCPHLPAPAPAGSNTTFWGITTTNTTAKPFPLPACDFGPYLNWVGRFADAVAPGACAATRWTVEQSGAGRRLEPADLLVAQRAKRGLPLP